MNAPPDRCPACGTENNAPPVQPGRTREYPDSVTGFYQCPELGCRRKWCVNWLLSALGSAA